MTAVDRFFEALGRHPLGCYLLFMAALAIIGAWRRE